MKWSIGVCVCVCVCVCVYRSGNVRVPLSCLRRRKIIDGGKFSVIAVNKIGGARK